MRRVAIVLLTLLMLLGTAVAEQSTTLSPAAGAPSLTNGSVFPVNATRGSGVVFRYSVTYQDPDADPADVKNLFINSIATPFTMSVSAGGDWLNGKVLYFEISVDSPNLLQGNNTFYFQVTDGDPTHIVRFPALGTFMGPVISAALYADFTASPTSGNAPLVVQFQDLSTGPIIGWSWDFGDGNGGLVKNPAHTYTQTGIYSVTLTVIGGGSTDTITKQYYIVIGGSNPPVANFIGTPTTGASPLTVQFTDQSTGDITSWSWTFGDGGTSTAQHPSHIYNNAGTYTVVLTVTGPGGNHAIFRSAYIIVTQGGSTPPVANFSGTPTSGNTPLTVQFSDLSTGEITSRSWTFGDGGTSTAANPSHIYLSAGNYTVSLTVTGPAGSNTRTVQNYITVTTSPAPVANFTANPTSGNNPLTVQFTDLSTGDIISRSWTFGDGGTSTSTNPSHTYSSVGSFTVTLTVTGPGGSNTKTSQNYITVTSATPAPVANFTANPTSGISPLTVQFTDLSTGDITSRSWTFGDGGTSTSINPSHIYSSAGSFTVTLTVTGPGGSNTKTSQNYITVTSPTPAPVANFSATPTSGISPLAVQFTDQSTGSITSRSWSFGDGGTSTSTNPSHTYSSAGSFTVTLTVTGPGGSNTKTTQNYITVTSPTQAPVANFSATPTSGASPLAVQFTDQSTGSITSRSWSFGDGGTSTSTNPSHTYSSTGSFSVTLTVTGPGGSNTKTSQNYITVTAPTQPPVANFSATPRSGTNPLTVQYTNQSIGTITIYTWTFGDGGISTIANPSHTYTTTGSFTVNLTVSGPNGTSSKNEPNYITVAPPGQAPVANFTATPTSGASPLTVQFTDLSTGEVTTRSWTFGDGGTSAAINPGYTYANTGSYTVSLTVSGPGGSNSKTADNYIVVTTTEELTANFWATPLTGAVPLTVEFVNRSVGTVTSQSWNFGDDQTSTNLNPFHTYNAVGYYTVSLTVNGPSGTDSKSRANFINVYDTANIDPGKMGISPDQYELFQNYPNPFNSRTTLAFHLPEPGEVKISIVNERGEMIDVLFKGKMTNGVKFLQWDAGQLPTDIYYVKMETPGFRKIIKCILIK